MAIDYPDTRSEETSEKILVNQWLRKYNFGIEPGMEGGSRIPVRMFQPIASQRTTSEERSSAELFADALKEYTANGRVQEGIVALYKFLGGLLRRKDIPTCDSLLKAVCKSAVDSRMLVALLMGTANIADKLTNRTLLRTVARTRLAREFPNEVDDVFKYMQ